MDTTKFTRRQTLASLGAGVSLAALPGCAQQLTRPAGPQGGGLLPIDNASANAFLERIAYNLLKHEPERATGLGVDTGEYAYLRGQLEDQSPDGQAALAETLKSDLALVRSLDTSALDADTRTSLEVVESAYDVATAGFDLPYGDIPIGSWRTAPYAVIQNVGTYLDMPRLLDSTHPLKTPDDAEAYAERLRALPAVLDGELARMREARGMGVVPPSFLLDKAIAQMESTLSMARSGELFLAQLSENLSDTGIARAWPMELNPLVTGPIAGALGRQLSELRVQRGMATGDPGMSARPRGDEWYAWALRSSTTTTMSPDEVHEQGLEELALLHDRMDPILREIGYTSGTVGERMQALSEDPRYKFAEGDPGRAEIMAFIEERIGWIKGQMPRAFNTLVDPRLEVKRLPLAEEPGAPGAYGGAGSKDGSIPGRMWINLRTTDLHRKYDLADLTFHETIPGHVWEGEYSNRLPLIRSILAFNAFSEGWALYAEQLADELGAYDDFKVGRLGYLQSLAFRACRMVVDTGLHHKRWSRERAVDFFVERNGSKREEVESEVDRYCSWPGQACGYKLGHSEIVRQRGRAQAAMGSAYDFKGFNDAVILGGNAPLDVLAKNVDRYIASV
ncbi:DUF885 domain-containing protein [Alteriqipengyuania flavescens]|uniref:DUF885 domain-containing protein n=1 Tax=Alteriqipengyuania flavescens TaxID=3053610 RepID=UPI0025B602B2|nr:DUF885 domain-containing protein [Alteriqipengyuania flavescens]WJY18788.1 DUF885 domain-containing protein [Alteriqipengyuania flavescens]WJY24728.1 DUF885 domain-containing protein [Alteriqipengyuania flavescens]